MTDPGSICNGNGLVPWSDKCELANASQHELARAYRANGQVEEGVELLEHVVKVQETTLAENHPSRLASQHALAGAHQANGQVKEAVKLLEYVVYIKSQIMAPAHPSRQVSERLLEQLR